VPLRRFRQLYGVFAIPEILRAGAVDLVHAHIGEDLAIVPLARWAARRARVPLVVTVHCSLRHTLEVHDLRSAILHAIGGPAELRLLRAAEAVLVLSPRLAHALETSGVPASLLRVVPLGLELDALRRPAARPVVMDGRRWIVFAGRLVPEKGVRDLVAALAELSARDAGLIIVGEGPDRARLETLARGLGVRHGIRFVGPIPHAQLRAYLQYAELVVLPSWFEERGRVLLEAMAAGTAVVGARAGGIPATVRHEVNGILASPRNPRMLAAAIDRVLADSDLAASMREAGRGTASEHGLPALADMTLDAYIAVLDRAVEGTSGTLDLAGAR
jgi:glycogen(starch) synthase